MLKISVKARRKVNILDIVKNSMLRLGRENTCIDDL